MPTSTFFRLPEEKRERLIQSCWEEVSQVRFTDISINRIITAAHIPRGSFYQYFEDKEDLIGYLLGDMRTYFIDMLRDILIEKQGDLFALPLTAYDRFMNHQGPADPMLDLFIKVMKLNQGFDIQSFIGGPPPHEFLPDQLWDVIDAGKLRHSSRAYADHIFHLSCAVLGFAVAETLCGTDEWARLRELLQTRMDVLRYGGASDRYKEENT